MGLDIEYIEGQTPLGDDDKKGLKISTITTREELDEFEQQNIEKSIEWTLTKKFSSTDILSEAFVRELHQRMFGDVWKWAGSFRKSNTNIGVDWSQIGVSLKSLNDDCELWIKQKTFTEEEIPIYYKHRIVSIHCFPNGNGRHSRLMADIIISHIFGRKVFTWSRSNLNKNGEARSNYIKAIKAADKGDIKLLLEFAKS